MRPKSKGFKMDLLLFCAVLLGHQTCAQRLAALTCAAPGELFVFR